MDKVWLSEDTIIELFEATAIGKALKDKINGYTMTSYVEEITKDSVIFDMIRTMGEYDKAMYTYAVANNIEMIEVDYNGQG